MGETWWNQGCTHWSKYDPPCLPGLGPCLEAQYYNYAGTGDTVSTLTWTNMPPVTMATQMLYYGHGEQKSVEPHAPAVLKRAERLLTRHISAKQRRTWERFRYVVVPSPTRPGVIYKVPASGMIRVYENWKAVEDLCLHGNESLPPADRVLALKLFIEAEEAEMLKTAKTHRLPGQRANPPRQPDDDDDDGRRNDGIPKAVAGPSMGWKRLRGRKLYPISDDEECVMNPYVQA